MKLRKTSQSFEVEIEDAKFNLLSLTEVQLEEVNYMLQDTIKAGHQVLPPKVVSYCLKHCLTGWTGVDDEYKAGLESYLPYKVRMELASEIYLRSQVTEDEKKS